MSEKGVQASYFEKMRGTTASRPARAQPWHIGLSALGGCCAIALVAYLSSVSKVPMVMGSFGASCVLIFAIPESPLSQPRNVIAGHFMSTLSGLVFLSLFGPAWWSMALALATALALMQLTNTVHPPAGSNPVIVMLAGAPWSFLVTPSLLGAVLLVIVGLLYNNAIKGRRYPTFW